MKRRLIIDGNEVYELDEDCMLKKRLDREEGFSREAEHRAEDRRKKKGQE